MVDFVHVPVRIVECCDDQQYPGWVACELVDMNNRSHRIIDKTPIFVDQDIDRNTPLPQPGTLRCKVIARFRDLADRQVIRITSILPDHVESTDGVSEFEVLEAQLSETL